MELNEMMDKELKRRFEDLENLKTGSDEQSKATDNIVKLYKLRMDENEQNVSKEADEDKLLLEKSKLELEAEKAKDDKLIRILTTVTSVGMEYKIEELTREVRKHNGFAEKIPVIQRDIQVLNHRMTDIETHEHERS